MARWSTVSAGCRLRNVLDGPFRTATDHLPQLGNCRRLAGADAAETSSPRETGSSVCQLGLSLGAPHLIMRRLKALRTSFIVRCSLAHARTRLDVRAGTLRDG